MISTTKIARIGIIGTSLLLFVLIHLDQITAIWEDWRLTCDMEARLAEARAWRNIKERLDGEILGLRKHLNTMTDTTSQSRGQASTVEFIQQQCKAAKLAITSIQPMPAMTSDNYVHQPIKVHLIGRYHAVGQFVYALETASDVIEVDYLKLSTKDLLSDRLDVEAHLSIYELRGGKLPLGD